MIMNKTVLISVFLSFIAFPCSMAGRDGNMKEKLPFRYEVRLGWGGYPLMDSYMFDESPFGNCDIAYASPSLGNLYRDYTGPKYMTGIISGEFNMIFKKWFTLSIGLNANGEFHYIYDGVTSQCKGSSGTAAISLVPQARFTYLNREYVKLYSSIGAGAVAYISKDETEMAPEFHISPIGIMVGKKVFGFFETGIGTLYMGCMAGIGFRF